MTPIPTVWWFRPDSSAARVGAQRAVVWKRLYFRPFPASRSAVGVAHGPPNALDAAKPTSSSNTTSTLGAPAGGRSGSIAGCRRGPIPGNDAAGSLASYGSVPSNGLSGTGSTSRRGPSDSAWLTKLLSTGCPSRHPPAPDPPRSSPDRGERARATSRGRLPVPPPDASPRATTPADTQHRTNRSPG